MGPIASQLDALRTTITSDVAQMIQVSPKQSSYTTIWRDYEDDVKKALCAVLERHIPSLANSNFELGAKGSEKNRLADLAIVCGPERIAIAVKAARRSQNPGNDLGTFNEYPTKKKMFSAFFDLWVRYDDADPQRVRIDRIFFDRSYKFVGKSRLVDGVKYRKKDGNMRPKSWAMFDSDRSYWRSEDEFEAGLKNAEMFRANALVEEHLQTMSEEDQLLLYEQLKKKFGP